jgi:hypothetical protein
MRVFFTFYFPVAPGQVRLLFIIQQGAHMQRGIPLEKAQGRDVPGKQGE